MLTTDELIAIVGGSLAGLVVILIILSVIIYCTCGRKKESDKDMRRFHQLTPNTDSSLSKHSTLSEHMDPRIDPRLGPRLPKVGSSGLWLGTPSMYPQDQSHGYYVDKPRGAIHRSSSETRVNPPGHAVYQGNLRIYHSNQQMPPLYEPYHGQLPRSSSYMELYNPYGYSAYSGGVRDSRAVLLEYPNGSEYYYDPYREREERRVEKSGKKVKRAHSDVTGNTTKRLRQKKRQETPSFDSRENNYRKDERQPKSRTASVEVHSRKSRDSSSSYTGRSASPTRHDRRQTQKPSNFAEDQIKTIDIIDDDLSACATDSAKLRAMQERAKEQDISKRWNNEELSLNLPQESDIETDLNARPYQYKGDIISVSEKSKAAKKDGYPDKNKGYINKGFTNSEHNETAKEKKHDAVERVESNADGKQVTAAFDFLNSYMSDDDGTDYMGSRPHSPHSPLPLNTQGADTYY